jgi:hypothetical protein
MVVSMTTNTGLLGGTMNTDGAASSGAGQLLIFVASNISCWGENLMAHGSHTTVCFATGPVVWRCLACLQKFHKLEQWKPVAATIMPPIENMPVQVPECWGV